jgi:hypothetical protein
VAATIWAMVAPFGRRSIATTCARLLSARALRGAAVGADVEVAAAFFGRPRFGATAAGAAAGSAAGPRATRASLPGFPT